MIPWLQWIDGKKTYLAAAVFACLAVFYFWQGENALAGHYALTALAIAGLRHAVAKVTPAKPPSAP